MGLPIHVGCNNGQTTQSIKPRLLNFPALPDESCEGHILTSLTHRSLVSIINICNAWCTDLFKSKQVTIKPNNKIVIQGPRYRRNGLWKPPSLPSPVSHHHHHMKNRVTTCVKHHRYQNLYNTYIMHHSELCHPCWYMPFTKVFPVMARINIQNSA